MRGPELSIDGPRPPSHKPWTLYVHGPESTVGRVGLGIGMGMGMEGNVVMHSRASCPSLVGGRAIDLPGGPVKSKSDRRMWIMFLRQWHSCGLFVGHGVNVLTSLRTWTD